MCVCGGFSRPQISRRHPENTGFHVRRHTCAAFPLSLSDRPATALQALQSLASAYNKLGDVQISSDLGAAASCYQKALKVRRTMAGKYPQRGEPDIALDLVVSMVKVADALEDDKDKAKSLFSEAKKLLKKLDPSRMDAKQLEKRDSLKAFLG